LAAEGRLQDVVLGLEALYGIRPAERDEDAATA
jgi:hypothetical protein